MRWEASKISNTINPRNAWNFPSYWHQTTIGILKKELTAAFSSWISMLFPRPFSLFCLGVTLWSGLISAGRVFIRLQSTSLGGWWLKWKLKKKKREQSTEGNVWVSSVIPEGLSRFTLCFCLDHKVYAWQDGWQNTKCRRLAGNDLSVPRPSFPGVSLLGSLATVVKLPLWRQMEDAGVSCLFGRLKHLVCGSLLPSVLNEAPGCRMKPLCLL